MLTTKVSGTYFHSHLCIWAVGEFLTTEEARRRQRIYDELASAGKLAPALIVIREHLPSRKACLRVNIDATKVGNVARFINHSCDGGNLHPVLVRSSGSLLPRLCFFAARDIVEGEELTFSYGDARVRPKGLLCFCGSSGCCGVLPSEETWELMPPSVMLFKRVLLYHCLWQNIGLRRSSIAHSFAHTVLCATKD